MSKETLKSLYVIATDIIDYTLLPECEKTSVVKDLESAIRASKAIQSLKPNKVIYCTAGDSIIVAIDDNNPRVAYNVAIEIVRNTQSENERRYPEYHLKIRLALNHGPGKIVKDIAGNLDILGECVDICTRVLSCVKQPLQIFCSEMFQIQIKGDKEA